MPGRPRPGARRLPRRRRAWRPGWGSSGAGALQPGETVLVLGASGVVGQIAVQAAKLLGAGRVVAAARSEEALERARELGADATVRLGAARPRRRAARGGRRRRLRPRASTRSGASPRRRRSSALGRTAGSCTSASRPAPRSRSPRAAVRSKPIDICSATRTTPRGEERKAAAYARMARPCARRASCASRSSARPRGRAGRLAAPGQLAASQAGRRPVAPADARDRHRRVGARGEARMGLLEVPAERAPAGPLAAHHREQRGERARRQRRDQPLQPQRRSRTPARGASENAP